jgi:hypothetical protein
VQKKTCKTKEKKSVAAKNVQDQKRERDLQKKEKKNE